MACCCIPSKSFHSLNTGGRPLISSCITILRYYNRSCDSDMSSLICHTTLDESIGQSAINKTEYTLAGCVLTSTQTLSMYSIVLTSVWDLSRGLRDLPPPPPPQGLRWVPLRAAGVARGEGGRGRGAGPSILSLLLFDSLATVETRRTAPWRYSIAAAQHSIPNVNMLI